ncbi:winged helix-turn-helix domain-containing protein [Synechococcus elongatus IITB7]|uniref:winged helix-turn-helix domain-containing protein n=1 Tax=Synechococcus elongatus TaxID=32046 RepID=UPI0030D50D1F
MPLEKFSDYPSYCKWFKSNHPSLKVLTEEQFYKSSRYKRQSEEKSNLQTSSQKLNSVQPSSIEKFSDYASYCQWFARTHPTLTAMAEEFFYKSVRYQKSPESYYIQSVSSSQEKEVFTHVRNNNLISHRSTDSDSSILDLNIMMTLRSLQGGTARQVSQSLKISQTLIQKQLDQLEAENFVVAEREAGKETRYQA